MEDCGLVSGLFAGYLEGKDLHLSLHLRINQRGLAILTESGELSERI